MNTIEHAAAAHAEGCRSARPRHLSRWTMPVVTLAVGAGMALNWGLLTVVGVAPFLLGALPCVAACALGLCVGAKSSLSLTVGRDLQ